MALAPEVEQRVGRARSRNRSPRAVGAQQGQVGDAAEVERPRRVSPARPNDRAMKRRHQRRALAAGGDVAAAEVGDDVDAASARPAAPAHSAGSCSRCRRIRPGGGARSGHGMPTARDRLARGRGAAAAASRPAPHSRAASALAASAARWSSSSPERFSASELGAQRRAKARAWRGRRPAAPARRRRGEVDERRRRCRRATCPTSGR